MKKRKRIPTGMNAVRFVALMMTVVISGNLAWANESLPSSLLGLNLPTPGQILTAQTCKAIKAQYRDALDAIDKATPASGTGPQVPVGPCAERLRMLEGNFLCCQTFQNTAPFWEEWSCLKLEYRRIEQDCACLRRGQKPGAETARDRSEELYVQVRDFAQQLRQRAAASGPAIDGYLDHVGKLMSCVTDSTSSAISEVAQKMEQLMDAEFDAAYRQVQQRVAAGSGLDPRQAYVATQADGLSSSYAFGFASRRDRLRMLERMQQLAKSASGDAIQAATAPQAPPPTPDMSLLSDDVGESIGNTDAGRGTVPTGSLILLIDTSSSMNGGPLAAARSAAQRTARRAIGNGLEVAVIGFSGACDNPVSARLPFTRDLNSAQHFIAGLSAAGSTPLAGAISAAAKYMATSAHPGPSTKLTILLGDGQADNGCDDIDGAIGRLHAANQMFRHDAVGLDIDPGSTAAAQLRSIAEASGGTYRTARDATEIARAFDAALDAISMLELIGKFDRSGSGTRLPKVRSTGSSEPVYRPSFDGWESLQRSGGQAKKGGT